MGVQLTTEMINGAIQTQKEYGVPASVTLGQILLESGGSNPGGLSDLAYKDNNLFGIKAGSSWQGDTSTYKTTEYINGKATRVNAKFRKYNNVGDSIADHGKLLSSSIYTNKTKGSKNITEYVQAMGSVYATDPNYSNLLLSIINDNNLTQYDDGNYSANTETAPTTTTTTQSNEDVGKFESAFSKIVMFIAVMGICILAVVFFMGAFNIKVPTKSNITKEALKDE